MALVVSMLNMKGGVGKTTLTFNLAWYAFYSSYKVLVIDLDPQSNLTQTLLGEDGYKEFISEQGSSVVDIFESTAKGDECIRPIFEMEDGSRLDLIPARMELSKTVKNPTMKEHKLRRYLNQQKPNYDLILIDCPPTDSILTVATYLASDTLVIPVKPEKLAIIGLPLLAGSIEEFNQDYAGENNIRVAGIIFNHVDPNEANENRLSKKEVSAFAESANWEVFDHEVRSSRAYVNGIREGVPMFETKRVRDYISDEFFQVGEEFLWKVGLK